MRPLLALHSDGEPKTQQALRESLAIEFALSPEELEEMLPSGTARTFVNRVAWASTHMKEAGLLAKPTRGVSQITPRGLDALSTNPGRVDMSILQEFSEYLEFRSRSSGKKARPKADEAAATDSGTPQEILETAYSEIREAVVDDLLSRLLDRDDRFFEHVVLDVLVALGYGGSRQDAAERVGRTGDGGIDGVIREDALGLEAIYVQAKKWATERTIGPREIREFIGALQDVEAVKGVFITTSAFSKEARELARRRRIVLLDGRELAGLMVDSGVGVTAVRRYEVRRIDEDYFVDVE